jgi:flagellar protein FlaG
MNITPLLPLAAQARVPAEAPVTRPSTADHGALIQAVKAVNTSGILGQDNELTFVVDRGSRQAVVRIVNKKTREVVLQIPDEHALRMAEEVNRG